MKPDSSNKDIFKQRPLLGYIRCDGADKVPHSHDFTELIFVSEGSGRFESLGNQYPVKTGDFIICGKNVVHSEYIFESSNSLIYHVGISTASLYGKNNNELIDEPFRLIHTQNESYAIIKAYMYALKDEVENCRPSSKLMADDILWLLTITVLRLAVGNADLLYIKNKPFFDAKEYFDKNFLTITNIEEVCEHLSINKYYLTHIFKEQLGMPPVRYLQYKRMEKAKTLILQGVPLSEAAIKCGYQDTSYFCKVFKRIVGLSPLQYRRKAQGVK